MMQFLTTLIVAVAIVAAAPLRAQAPTAVKDWELVRSVSDEQGGTMDFVIVPAQRQRDRAHYESIAKTICGSKRLHGALLD